MQSVIQINLSPLNIQIFKSKILITNLYPENYLKSTLTLIHHPFQLILQTQIQMNTNPKI